MHDDPFARAVERVETAEQAERAARRQKRAARHSDLSKRGFHVHATVFVAVNLLLIAIWATTWQLLDGTSYPWFIWVLLGWGVGLAAHWSAQRGKRPAANDVDQAAELERLAELHRAGSLSDDEFRAAKAKLLA
jgi:hypothetical protein